MAHLMSEEDKLLHELSFYTLSHASPDFIHQQIVDAYGAQSANETTKPIRILFSLVGLYLYVEEGFIGKEVQLFHQKMARQKKAWPKLHLPKFRGEIKIGDVLKAGPGEDRDRMIRLWSEDVWKAFQENRTTIIDLIQEYRVH